jgi:hypothetical protein
VRRDAVGGHNAGADVCRWGSNLPNDVAASLDPVVQEGQACVGNEIGEAHICSWGDCVYGRKNRSGVVENRRGVRHSFSGGRRLQRRKICTVHGTSKCLANVRSQQPHLHKSLCIWSTIVCRGALTWNYSKTISCSQLFIVELLVLWVSSAIDVESRRSIAALR